VEELDVANHPQKEDMGRRKIPFGRELYIEQNDFAEVPPKKFKRLIPGGEVRLRGSYVMRCDEIIKDGKGDVIELRCSYDPDTLGKNPQGRKVKGVIHWVSVEHAVEVEVRLYDRLFSHPSPDSAKEGKDYKEYLNSGSLLSLTHCYLEPSLAEASPGELFQFERQGYFCLDEMHSHGEKPVYNRTVTLRDTWAKIVQK